MQEASETKKGEKHDEHYQLFQAKQRGTVAQLPSERIVAPPTQGLRCRSRQTVIQTLFLSHKKFSHSYII